ncbi:MAG: methyltransferase domain-containing protein [Myxococcota bacterium]
MVADILQGFQRPDAADEAHALFRFLDAVDGLDFIHACKRQMRELGPVEAGHAVLDVGCGLGHEAQRFAASVGPSGRVVGVDHGEATIAEARRRAEAPSLALELHVGDAHALDLADDSFDLVRSERVLEYVAEPPRVLAEMMRVARPGGAVVNFDFDYDSLLVDHPDRRLIRQLKHIFFDSVPHAGVATHLPGLYRAAGLADVRVTPITFVTPLAVLERLMSAPLQRAAAAGAIAREALAAWWDHLRAADAAGRFFATVAGFIVAGRKPG